jgi:hypothetical protein
MWRNIPRPLLRRGHATKALPRLKLNRRDVASKTRLFRRLAILVQYLTEAYLFTRGGQVRKNTYQTQPRISTARQVLIIRSISTDGPGSAWRASFGVSMIIPCFLVAMRLSPRISALDQPGQRQASSRYRRDRSLRVCPQRRGAMPLWWRPVRPRFHSPHCQSRVVGAEPVRQFRN